MSRGRPPCVDTFGNSRGEDSVAVLRIKRLNHLFYAKCRPQQWFAAGRFCGVDNRPYRHSQKEADNRLAGYPQIFSLLDGGYFQDKKNIFFENGICLAKIPTKSIFNSGKRKKKFRHKIITFSSSWRLLFHARYESALRPCDNKGTSHHQHMQ